MFVSGYLALLSAITIHEDTGGYYVQTTEVSAPGYNRQPIAFSDVVTGVTYSATSYTFGQTGFGQVGLAVFASPIPGGTIPGGDEDFLMFVMPYATPPAPARPRWEQGEAGHLRLSIPVMRPYAKGEAFNGLLGFEVGTWNDRYDVTGVDLSTGAPVPTSNVAKFYTPNAVRVVNGTVQP